MAGPSWKQAFAAAQKINKKGLWDALRNECYQRTPTDEYPFRKKSRGRFKPVSEEQKAVWRKLADR